MNYRNRNHSDNLTSHPGGAQIYQVKSPNDALNLLSTTQEDSGKSIVSSLISPSRHSFKNVSTQKSKPKHERKKRKTQKSPRKYYITLVRNQIIFVFFL